MNTPYHPQKKGYLGFIVTLEGVRFYYAGDTDLIPEMREIKVDLALLPVSGRHVMGPEDAAAAALALRPQVAVPMHYRVMDASRAAGECFRGALAGELRVELLSKS